MLAPRTVRCTFLVAAANRALFTDARASIPEPGDPVSYDGHDYEVITATEQLPPTPDIRDGDAPMSAVVRIQPVDTSAGSS
jgi:hypothetical protein